jgi:hypothetical protein
MKPTRTVAQEFAEFAEKVLDKVPRPSVQFTESRRCFYAGAFSFMTMMMAEELCDAPDDVGIQYLEERKQEIMTFYALLAAGVEDY